MFPEHCILKSLVLFALLHIILGIMNNGSFLVQLTGKLIFAYVKSLVTVILLVPHCIYPIANQKIFASLLVKLVLKIAAVDDMLPPKTIILTLVSVP